MINKKKKLNMLKVRRCIIIAIAIILFIIAIILLKNRDKYKELTILYNNEFIELTKAVIIDEKDNIFFSKDDVKNLFDETMYYNELEKELITTYNSNIALLKIDENFAEINDESIKLNGLLCEKDNSIYMPITDLKQVYDIEIEYSKESNRIIIDSILKEKKEATIKKKTKVKTSKGMFGKKIENKIIGDKVVILETVRKI